MAPTLTGIHHVTAIVEDPQENIDFYTIVLGLRLVKQTVNFDDPYTYHLYYGDEIGHPGTVITFFPWPAGRRGSRGTGQISAIAFAVPMGALAFWRQHLTEQDIRFSEPEMRLGNATLSLYDPAGLLIELVEQPHTEALPSGSLEIAPEVAIQRLFGVTLTLAHVAPTAALLTERLGFHQAADTDGVTRFVLGTGDDAATVDLVEQPGVARGQIAAGSVHHVAWRVADDQALEQWQQELERAGADVTEVRERQYFRSIYFHEPGCVLFEIATDQPGFATDESPDALGTHLMLPPWLEPQRTAIEEHLPPIRVPGPRTTHDASVDTKETPSVTQPAELAFIHRFYPAQSANAPTLLLLHGTGGNEDDLVQLGRMLSPEAALLSPRGQVLEHGMPRFFRRLAEGVFDLDDLRQRTDDLATFVAAASATYGFDPLRVIAVGFSNGANIAASLLLLRPRVLAGAVLFHAMVPLVPEKSPDLRNVPVFLGAGRTDPLVPTAQTEQLAHMLQTAGADVELHWEAGGHALNGREVQAATTWLRGRSEA